MTDTISAANRSWNMSRIKRSNTKPELTVRSYLHRHGLRFRIDSKKLPGKPDIVLTKYNTAIFVDGCFWHRHKGCKYAYTPKTKTKFWNDKFKNNIQRDKKVNYKYSKLDWNQIRIWECEISERELSILIEQIKGIN